MKLKKQLKILADEAPQYGIPLRIMEKAVIPILFAFAQQRRYEEYYILQNQVGDWLISTISNRHQPQIEKKVIYAFGTLQDAVAQNTTNSRLEAYAIPVTHLLFQMFALGQIDSIVFMEKSGNLNDGVEISRIDIQQSLQHQLKQLKATFSAPSNLA